MLTLSWSWVWSSCPQPLIWVSAELTKTLWIVICWLLPPDQTAITSTAWKAPRVSSKVWSLERDPDGLPKFMWKGTNAPTWKIFPIIALSLNICRGLCGKDNDNRWVRFAGREHGSTLWCRFLIYSRDSNTIQMKNMPQIMWQQRQKEKNMPVILAKAIWAWNATYLLWLLILNKSTLTNHQTEPALHLPQSGVTWTRLSANISDLKLCFSTV